VKVYLEKYLARVQLGVDAENKLAHFQNFDRSVRPSRRVLLGVLSISFLEAQAQKNQQYYSEKIPLRQRFHGNGALIYGQWVLKFSPDEIAEYVSKTLETSDSSKLSIISFYMKYCLHSK